MAERISCAAFDCSSSNAMPEIAAGAVGFLIAQRDKNEVV
jgi:hypothetical protein